jgi:hypothetical protein
LGFWWPNQHGPDGRRAKAEHQGPGTHQESLIAALMPQFNWS